MQKLLIGLLNVKQISPGGPIFFSACGKFCGVTLCLSRSTTLWRQAA